MDFSKITNISIPEGNVLKIVKDNAVLWKRPGLPDSYQQVEYIATDGNQYINTGVIPANYPAGLNYSLNFRITNWTRVNGTSNVYTYLFGATENNSKSGNFAINAGAGHFRLELGDHIYATYSWANLLNQDCEFNLTATAENVEDAEASLTIDGAEQLSVHAYGSHNNSAMPELPIYLFGCNGSNNAKPIMRCYSFKINDSAGIPRRNYIPCCRKADGAVGLYDTVTQSFYENEGTGSFEKGNDVT